MKETEYIDKIVNPSIKYNGLFVYSVTIVDNATNGLNIKFLITIDYTLNKRGKSSLLIW